MDLDISIKAFPSFEEESIGSIQFNGEIMNMMLPTDINLNSKVFDHLSGSSAGYSLLP